MRDPYEVLGLSRTADHAEIKKSFRRLAKKHHPDSSKGDPKAAARFSEANSAYEILGDEKKRKQFDAGEIDAEGKPRGFGFDPRTGGAYGQQGPGGVNGDTIFETFSYGPGGFQRGTPRSGQRGGQQGGNFEDVLSDVLGGMFGSGGRRARARGGFTGFEEFEQGQQKGADIALALEVTLGEAASGAKKRVTLPTGKEIEVTIPAGVVYGQQIRLRGQGFAGPAMSGDALVTIHVAPHPELMADGIHLRADVALPLEDAVLGGSVRVPTLDGAVDLKIPAGTSGGRTFRLKGKGLPQQAGPAGDLLVTVNVTLPDQPNAELEALAKKLRAQK